MCGIVGYVGERDALPIILQSLKRIEYRGYDSAGIACITDNGIEVYKDKGKVDDVIEKINYSKSISSNSGIGHCRWATHGAPSKTNAHPHLDGKGEIAVVHNGIIENFLSLKE